MMIRPSSRPACVLVLVAVIFGVVASTEGSETVARQLFERYVALGQAYDTRLADLYSDDALIRNKRTYPTGEVRNYTSPISLLVGPSPTGQWLIYEEISESRP